MAQLTPEDGPEINPSVVFLFDLLKWVRQGRVRVPAFQRPYVWSRSNMLDLFDSVRCRYPIGTLLFWRSSTTDARPLKQLGPFALPDPPGNDTLLLLDGQQRLTTLAGVLLRGSGLSEVLDANGDSGRWEVYFDASGGIREGAKGPGHGDGIFLHLSAEAKPQPWQVPLHRLADTKQLFQATEDIYSTDIGVLDGAGVPRETLVDRLQGVARALQSYKIPIVEFVTDDLNLAVESFTRLNRKGVSIGADEMFSALTYQAGATSGRFHIANEIDRTLTAVKQTGFGSVDRVLVLRAFLVAADLDPYRTDWSRLGEETRETVVKKLPDAMMRAREGLLSGIRFLAGERIHNARMLPYGLQLVGLSAWLGENPDPGEDARVLLRRWLWLTGFASWFGQGNPSRYAAVLSELRDAARRVRGGAGVPAGLKHLAWSTPTEPFPERYDLRSARVRTLLCLLARHGVMQMDGTQKDARGVADDFARNGPEAMRVIWPGAPSLRSSPANRMFNVFGDQRGQPRVLLRQLPDDAAPAFCDAHLLPFPLADALWDNDQMEKLLEQRLQKMIDLERNFMAELKIEQPVGSNTGRTLIDQDDEPTLPPADEPDA
jgi:hypothetical protein